VNASRRVLSLAVAVVVVSAVGVRLSAQTTAQAPASPADNTNAAKAKVFTGGWNLNREQSDQPQSNTSAGGDVPRGGGRHGGGGGRGGGFGGGFGGGRGGATGGNDPQAAARLREATRDIMNPPDHLVVVSTDTMLVLTAPDGRTVRLSPDNKKVKDESTNIERKTKWDGVRLVSEITGLGSGKITETYTVDDEHHQLHVVTVVDAGRGGQPRTVSHLYDQDAR
jgi:hypothetical protein